MANAAIATLIVLLCAANPGAIARTVSGSEDKAVAFSRALLATKNSTSSSSSRTLSAPALSPLKSPSASSSSPSAPSSKSRNSTSSSSSSSRNSTSSSSSTSTSSRYLGKTDFVDTITTLDGNTCAVTSLDTSKKSCPDAYAYPACCSSSLDDCDTTAYDDSLGCSNGEDYIYIGCCLGDDSDYSYSDYSYDSSPSSGGSSGTSSSGTSSSGTSSSGTSSNSKGFGSGK